MISWKELSGIEKKITVIPCCVDLDLFKPRSEPEKDRLRTELNLSHNDFVLLYIGSLGTWYMLEEMIDFYKYLKSRIPSTRFLLLTDDPNREIIQIAQRKGGLDEDMIITQTQRENIPTFIQLADLNLFFIRPVFSKKASSPTKLGEIIAMGGSLICNSGIGDVDDDLKDYDQSFLIQDFTENHYLKGVAWAETRLQNLVKTTLPVTVRNKYSLQSGLDRYKEVLKNCV